MQGLFLKLPTDVEHQVHEFLRVAEVCALQRVSASWRTRIGRALRTLPWKLVYCDGVDLDAHTLLTHLALASVNIRILELVRPHGSYVSCLIPSYSGRDSRSLTDHEEAVSGQLEAFFFCYPIPGP